jgi:hypothetical protein
MGLAWQQGPIAPGAIGRFLVPDPLPDWLLYADGGDVTLLDEPGRYPVAYFPPGDIADGVVEPSGHTTRHMEEGMIQAQAMAARIACTREPRWRWKGTCAVCSICGAWRCPAARRLRARQ